MPEEPQQPQAQNETLNKVNALLAQVQPTIGLAFSAIALIRELFRRKQAGEADLTLEQMADFIDTGANRIIKASNDWLAQRPQFDPQTGRPR